jgi:hypothetical protein
MDGMTINHIVSIDHGSSGFSSRLCLFEWAETDAQHSRTRCRSGSPPIKRSSCSKISEFGPREPRSKRNLGMGQNGRPRGPQKLV